MLVVPLLLLLSALPAPGQSEVQDIRPVRLRVPSARCSFLLPPGFEREWVRAPELRPQRPRQYVGSIAGHRARLIVTIGDEHFTTVSRALAARYEEGTIEDVDAARQRGEVLAFVVRTERGRGQEIHEVICCPWQRAVSLALVFETRPGPTARRAARRVLESFELLPDSEITRSVLPEDQREAREIAIGFSEKDRERVRIAETEHYRLYTTASGNRTLLELLERELPPRMRALTGDAPWPRGLDKLPIFLHRTRGAYVLAALRNGIPRPQAATMEAHAWDRYFSASYLSPRDPVLIHEATHQYVTAVLGLDGGGPWLQEGIARWTEAKFAHARPERTARNLLQRERLPPLRKLLQAPSLFHVVLEGQKLEPSETYDVAASLVLYLEELDAAKLRALVLQAGVLPSGDLRLLEAAFHRSLGLSIQDFERDWRAWLNR